MSSKPVRICIKCKNIISPEDDYGGTYVWAPEGFYHYICFKEHEREIADAGLTTPDGYPE